MYAIVMPFIYYHTNLYKMVTAGYPAFLYEQYHLKFGILWLWESTPLPWEGRELARGG